MSKTIWEMLRGEKKIEPQIDNPLNLKIGSTIQIKEIDLQHLTFFVKRILEYKRTINDDEFVFTDYELSAAPSLGTKSFENQIIRLRLNPMETPDKAAGLTHDVLLLKMYDEMEYSEELYKVLTDDTKIFEVMENGECTERYWRINDVQDFYTPKISVVEENRFSTINDLKYWDFFREITNEAEQKVIEFLFVEMDGTNGWFQMWKGQEIDPLQVGV